MRRCRHEKSNKFFLKKHLKIFDQVCASGMRLENRNQSWRLDFRGKIASGRKRIGICQKFWPAAGSWFPPLDENDTKEKFPLFFLASRYVFVIRHRKSMRLRKFRPRNWILPEMTFHFMRFTFLFMGGFQPNKNQSIALKMIYFKSFWTYSIRAADDPQLISESEWNWNRNLEGHFV